MTICSESYPAVTAMMAVHNERDNVSRAVNSLLGQSLKDIEVLVVDDGSHDGTSEILKAINDPRLRVIRKEDRGGQAAALALAAEEARGRYVANLDADDVAYPDRLKKQAAFLDARRDHGWVGGAEDRRDAQRGENYIRRYPLEDAAIRRQAARCIPYCHTGIMFRRRIVEEGINYDPTQPYLIDFHLFLRIAKKWKVANLSDPVVVRNARDESFYQRRFKRMEQNKRLAALSLQAITLFRLPAWYRIYPAARLGYPYVPNIVKRPIRALGGLIEQPFTDDCGVKVGFPVPVKERL